MRVIVIGLGSMGKRRIRLLKESYPDVSVIGVDRRRDRRIEVENLYTINTYSDVEGVPVIQNKDSAFVCTSPNTHPEIILECLNRGMHIFTEMNLLHTNHQELIKLAEEKGLKLFLSSTMLCRKETQYIEKKVADETGRIHYRYHVGQYLPDWHPWENYEDFFVVDPETNGCRELFAIELPWMIKSFGKITEFTVKKEKLTKLKLDYPDSYLMILEHESGHKGILQLDVVSRQAVRSFEMTAENIYLTWDGKPDGLMDFSVESKEAVPVRLYDEIAKDGRYAENIIENAYLNEIREFFNWMQNPFIKQRYSMAEELEVLRLVDEIERK